MPAAGAEFPIMTSQCQDIQSIAVARGRTDLAGVPAIALPIPSAGFSVPVSLQIVGPIRSEDLLCALELAIEGASQPTQ